MMISHTLCIDKYGTKVLVLFETNSILIMKSLKEGLLKVVLYSIKNIAKIELFRNNIKQIKLLFHTFATTY